MTAWCSQCGDEFDPIEGNEPAVDPDEPRFCSDECAEYWQQLTDAEEAYYSERGGASVWL